MVDIQHVQFDELIEGDFARLSGDASGGFVSRFINDVNAIRDAGLGLNPAAEGQTVRVPVPELTQERRAELSKVAGKYAEQARISVRNVRRDGMEMLKKMEKDGELSQDEQRDWSDKIQKTTDAHIKSIDDTLANKEKEIMQV